MRNKQNRAWNIDRREHAGTQQKAVQTGGVSSKVTKAGVEVRTKETIHIGPKTTTARGMRYLTQEDFEKQIAAGLLTVIEEKRDKQGNLEKVFVESVRYVEPFELHRG